MHTTQVNKELSWDDLASWYDSNIGGRSARTLPMEKVLDVCLKSGSFIVLPNDSIAFKGEV